MLKNVLKEIKSSDYISKKNIATKLNSTESLVEDVFFQLERMAYIEEDVMANCDANCGGCPYATSCSDTPIKSYLITEKGEELLKK